MRTIGWVALLLLASSAGAVNHLIAIDEVLGSWQGDDSVQFVQLRMLAAGQQLLSDGGGTRGTVLLVFDDASGSPDTRRVFTFTHDLQVGLMGSRILIATPSLTTLSGFAPDFVLPAGMLAPRNGRVCYFVSPPQDPNQTTGVIDCVAYGAFTGDNGSFGAPTPVTPDNRSIRRVAVTGRNADDWGGVLAPDPTNDAGSDRALVTLCGDGNVSQGEQCDGDALAGATCASLGFASGALACKQCHFDTSPCSFCGNGAINGREQCDGADLGGRTCAALGFTGGTLGCTSACRLSTTTCDPTFLVPGGGPPGPECLAEWQVMNALGRPKADGKAPVRQRCRDGDPGCDGDQTTGTCTFEVALCLDRTDARLPTCRARPIGSWTVLKPALGDGDAAATLLAAAATLGPSVTAGSAITFTPPLDASARCTAAVPITVATRGQRPGVRVLRTRTTAAAGHPRDLDTLKLVCAP
jgi:hypothetical protein